MPKPKPQPGPQRGPSNRRKMRAGSERVTPGRLEEGADAPGGGLIFILLIEAVKRLLPCLRPADVVLREFFRAHPVLGRKDRARIAQAAFGVLRHRRRLEHLCTGGPGARERLLGLAALRMTAGAKACAGVVAQDPDLARWLAAVGVALEDPARLPALAPAVRNSLPDWLHEKFAAQWSGDELEALEASLLEPAPLDLRVNTLKGDLPAVLDALAQEGFGVAALPMVAGALRVQGHPALERSKTFLDGLVEVQDAGSQWLVSCVGARRGETIVDFCAGAGGKTLALAAAMRGTGQVFAVDVSAARLAKLRPRLVRAGATNVQPMLIESEDDPRLLRLKGRADRVLVDAPCSGTGTLRRNPDLKWRQTPRDLIELTARQLDILSAAARLVKPGGRLFYATCSLIDAENDGVAMIFAQRHPEFMPIDPDPAGLGVQTGFPGARALWPQRTACDGFYVAAFERARVIPVDH